MTPITPITQPAGDLIRNAAMIAQASMDAWRAPDDPAWRATMQRITALLREALDALGEPNEAALQAAAPWVEEHGPLAFRNARDLCAVILRAQLEGGLR